MRRELVRCLRTVALLAVFSTDDTTVSNVQSALKSMVIMEPDLILPSVLERAVPSLEALTETQRTIAIMKALGSVGLGMVSRDIYYPGAKHLLPVLELLIPGIDLVSSFDRLVVISVHFFDRMTPPKLFAQPLSSSTFRSTSNLAT
jgi:proteasome activator subunit 4